MLVAGTVLAGRYEILGKVGSGGMADVYKSRDSKLNRLVAIKVLKAEFSNDATFVKKFRTEAQSAAGLSHPNVVNVYDTGEEDGIYYIVMELVQGITLKNYIDMKGKLEIREALNISIQVASGLSAAHANRIIHRDIKPQNIIMSRDGKVKVTDFGIAKAADSTTITTSVAGSVHYISPEQARGGYSDVKSDIYSLGITMYEMLTGQVPFDGETNVAVAMKHIQNPIVSPRALEPSIPRSFERIILKCTQKKPEFRYASARELIADLRRVLAEPDGEYVVLGPSQVAVKGSTITMNDTEVGALKNASVNKSNGNTQQSSGYKTDRNRVTENERRQERQPEQSYREEREERQYRKDPEKQTRQDKRAVRTVDVEDYPEYEDERTVSPALDRTLMFFGIIGAVVLIIVIFVIVGKAAGIGFLGNSSKSTEATKATIAETQSETQVTVPDCSGQSQAEAKKNLNAVGIGVNIEREASDDVAAGFVTRTDPSAGTAIKINSQVTVYVSTGPETEASFSLEDVSGLSYNDAASKLQDAGLKVNRETEYSDSVEVDLVTRTNPESGASVKAGESITVYVSEGPEVKHSTVPDLKNLSYDEALTAVGNANLYLNVASYEYNNDVSSGLIIRQDLTESSSVEEWSTVSVVISNGPETTAQTGTTTVSMPSQSPFYAGGTTAGNISVVVSQDGQYDQTVYTAYCTVDTYSQIAAASTVTVTGVQGNGVVKVYIDGAEYATWNVTFY